MTRSKYFKRKRVRTVFILWMKEWVFNAAVAIVLAATILLIWRAFNPPITFTACPTEVAALRVPPAAMSNLHSLADTHDMPFGRVLALYAVANEFFPQGGSPPVDVEMLQASYITGFNRLYRRYTSREIRPYFEMFDTISSELEHFPVPQEYEYIFSDTWGQISGTAILDQKNIRGRIPVLSMTAGTIRQAGWHPRSGYHIVVLTPSGSRILYAHLDSLGEGVEHGQQVEAGQQVGMMGNSGDVYHLLPVHLHIGISPQVTFAEDFWVNPYPFLRLLDEKQ